MIGGYRNDLCCIFLPISTTWQKGMPTAMLLSRPSALQMFALPMIPLQVLIASPVPNGAVMSQLRLAFGLQSRLPPLARSVSLPLTLAETECVMPIVWPMVVSIRRGVVPIPR